MGVEVSETLGAKISWQPFRHAFDASVCPAPQCRHGARETMKLYPLQKTGTIPRVRIPTKEKLHENDSLSATYPIPNGKTPPPTRNPLVTTNDTARLLRFGGNTEDNMTNAGGNMHAEEAAWRKTREELIAGFRMNPRKRMHIPVTAKKKTTAIFCPARSAIQP